MNKINFLFFVIGVIALTSCTSTSLRLLGQSTPAQLEALEYYDWTLTATPKMAGAETDRLVRDIQSRDAEKALVQMALLLSVAGTSAEKDAQDLALLTQFVGRARAG